MEPMATPAYRNIPDSYGTNAYLSDPDFAHLLRVYLDKDVVSAVEPRFVELGGLVRGELEDLALAADRNPPVLHLRARNSSELQKIEKHPSYAALERYAFSEYGLAAMSHRGDVFGRAEKMPPAVKYGLTMLFVQAEFGLCCPLSMTDLSDADALQVRFEGTDRPVLPDADDPGFRGSVSGRDVHHRAGRRLRRRRGDDRGAA